MTGKYFVSYYMRDPKTGQLKLLATNEIDDSNTHQHFPLAAKAFRHAPEKARHATRLEFEKLSSVR